MNIPAELSGTIIKGLNTLTSDTTFITDCIRRGMTLPNKDLAHVPPEAKHLGAIIGMYISIIGPVVGLGWTNFKTYQGYDRFAQYMRDVGARIPSYPVNPIAIPLNVTYDIAYELGIIVAEHDGLPTIDSNNTFTSVPEAFREMLDILITSAGDKFTSALNIILDSVINRRFPDGTYHKDARGQIINPPGWKLATLEALWGERTAL